MSDTLIDRLVGFDSATIANAIEQFEVRDRVDGFMSMEVRCLFPDLPPVAGYAVTVMAETTPDPADLETGWEHVLDAVNEAPKPAILVIGWWGDDRSRGCVAGDMVASGLRRLGAVALIADTGVRDQAGMRRNAPRMQVFARGLVPSHGRVHLLAIGEPVEVAGLRVEQGALLHGDENGVVEIPIGIADQVEAAAQRVREREQAYSAALAESDSGYATIRRWLGPH